MKHNTLLFLLLVLVSVESIAKKMHERYFIENKGQWDKEILYLCRMNNVNAWITRHGVTYDFYGHKDVYLMNEIYSQGLENKFYTRYGQVVKVEHLYHNDYIFSEPKYQKQGFHNYFIGNEPKKWATYVGLYEEIVIKNIYNGIDQRWYFDGDALRYDYIVGPHADYKQIKILVKGSDSVKIKENDLVFKTLFGEVHQSKLFVYQTKNKKIQPIASKWIQDDKGYFSFELSEYDPQHPLIIDPLLWSTYLGGSSEDYCLSVAIDASNNVYVTGYTTSSDYPVTTGVYDTSYNGGGSYPYDVFVSKLNSSGSTLLYSTFIGGTGAELAEAMTVTGSGDVYLTGSTTSSDFPVTMGVFDNTYNGPAYPSLFWGDAFILRLNSTGSTLIFSTFIGGNEDDIGRAIYVDDTGNIYCSGAARANFPVTSGAFDTSYNYGPYDGFILKMNPTGTTLFYCTYYGGSGNDTSNGISVDDLGNAYVTGNTHSYDFPTTAGSFDTSFNGTFDGHLVKINPTGTSLVYSTFIGGSNQDRHFGIILRSNYNIVLSGFSDSADYPTTIGAYDTSHNGGHDAVLTEINAAGSSLVYSTYIGGANSDASYCLTQSFSGLLYMSGSCGAGFPTTAGAYDVTHNGGSDVFIAIFHPLSGTLLYSTYIGDSGNDIGRGITTDNAGHPIVAGPTNSLSYPTTAGSYDISYNGGSQDVFVTKLDPSIPLPHVLFNLSVNITENHTSFLTWYYAGDKQPDKYVIEYKIDDRDAFQYLSDTKKNYYHDRKAVLEAYQQGHYSVWYKVRVLDKNGTSIAEQTQKVSLNLDNLLFSIYPNFNRGTFIFQTTQDTHFDIMDMQSRIVYKGFAHKGTHEVSLGLSSGVYWLNVPNLTPIKFIVL